MAEEATTQTSGGTEAATTTEATPNPAASTATPENTGQDMRSSLLATFKEMSGEKRAEGATPEPEAASEPEPAETETDEEIQQTTEDEPEAIDPDELKKAKDVLKRAKWDAEDIDRLPPDRLLQKAEFYKKKLDDDARQFEEYRRTKLALEQIERERMEASREQQQANAQAQPRKDAVPLSESVKAKIGEILAPLKSEENAAYYGDLVDPLAIGFTTIAEQIQSEHQSQLQAIEAQWKADKELAQQQYAALVAQMDRTNLRMAADDPDIRKEFPELRKPDVFSKVVNKAISLSNLTDSGYHDERGEPIYSELIRDAAALVIERKDPVKQAQARLAKQQRIVADGQTVPDSGAANRPRSMSPREAMVHAAKQLASGKKVDQVKRELAKAG